MFTVLKLDGKNIMHLFSLYMFEMLHNNMV